MSQAGYMLFEAGEVLAVPLAVAQEVIVPLPTTPVPHRSHPGFWGLVDWQGRVVPCVCLPELLGLALQKWEFNKMVVLTLCGETIVFPAERVLGIRKLSGRTLEPPKPGSDAMESVSQGFFREVGATLLDEEKLFAKVQVALTSRV